MALALEAVVLGKEGGLELARTLLSRADIDVNTGSTSSDGIETTPLALALDAVILDKEGGLELARTLLSHADIDVNTGSDTPLALALMAAIQDAKRAEWSLYACCSRTPTST